MIYLDNAATTLQKPVKVREAMLSAFDTCANAGRGGYESSMTAAEYVFNARERISNLFGLEKPENVAFTHNATYALNMAIKGVARQGNCVISGYEHNSVVRPLEALKRKGISYSYVSGRLFDSEGMLKGFCSAMKKGTSFAVCTHMSNVFGYILPIKEIDQLCYSKGVPLIIDASQSAGCVPINFRDLKATVCVCAPGHKGLYGPQGTGILICKDGKMLNTLIEGGTGSESANLSQPQFLPDRFESGTQNIPGIAGLSEGIAYVLGRGVDKILLHEQDLIKNIVSELRLIPNVKVYASEDMMSQGGVLSFNVNGAMADDVALYLSNNGIAVRSGLQCSPLAHKTVGTTGGTVRVSVSDFTTQNDIELFLSAIKSFVGKKPVKI